MACSRRSIWAAAVACMLAAGCVRNPATGQRQLNFVSREQEIELGKQGAQDVAVSIGVYDNESLEQLVDRVGKRLAAVSERPKLPWSFRVVDDAAVNAFALPGGFIFVTRGLLAHLENEAQLATVMGHEIGHVTAQHSTNQMSKAQLAELSLGLGALVSESVRQWGSIGAGGLQLLFLKFGRDDERQADDLGLRYALKAGYDVRETPKVFELLRRVSEAGGGGGRVPNWLATHPDPGERVERSEKRVAALDQDLSGLERDESDLMSAIDGIVYGNDPREGFFEGDRFYHPGLGFSIAFPRGFQGLNTKQAVGARNETGDAAMELRLAPVKSAEEGMRAFLRESGVEARGDPSRVGRAIAVPFVGQTEQGTVAGLVGFVQHRGRTLQLLGVTSPEQYASYREAFAKSMASFDELRDRALLGVQPKRLQVEKLSKPTPISELKAQSAVSADELALINQVPEGAVLPAGGYAKWVVRDGAGAKQ